MGADQVLEYEVVATSGSVNNASTTESSDLYWALSGGGPGTYRVITSVTVRAHQNATIGGGYIALAKASTTEDNFWEAISKFHAMLPNFTDAGAMVAYELTSNIFAISPVTLYNSSTTYVDEMLALIITVLTYLFIPYEVEYTKLFYYDHYNTILVHFLMVPSTLECISSAAASFLKWS